MGIFGDLKGKIFGVDSEPETKSAVTEAVSAAAEAKSDEKGWFAKGMSDQDLKAMLAKKADAKGQKLNWETSIADLMRLVDMDPSLDNRKELANELGYKGELNGSAEMNIWLHKQVMDKLSKGGDLN